MFASLKIAKGDLLAGLARREFWMHLAWNDVKSRHRRSILGPLWNAANLAIFVAILGILYAQLMDRPFREYVPHLTLGMITWNLFSNSLIEGCRLFIGAQSYIKEIYVPLSVFVYRLLWRNLIVLGYQFLVFVGVCLVFGLKPTVGWLLAIPGLTAVLTVAFFLSLVTGVIATRFRDFTEIISSLLRITFFVTPIIWMPGTSGRFQLIADMNPLYHVIEAVRGPLLDTPPELATWAVVTALVVLSGLLSILLFGRVRDRIPFWL